MGQPRFLVKNFFSRRIYPAHVLLPSEELAGNEMSRIGNGNRDPLDFWTTTTANLEATGRVDDAVSRAADMVVIDRGHNLASKQVVLERSANGTTWTTVVDVTIPSASAPGALSDANGVVNREGAWLKTFASASDRYWRLRIPAMGVGLKPQVVNAWLDTSWAPPYRDTPDAPDAHELGAQEITMQTGWIARSHIWVRRRGHIGLRLEDSDYDVALEQIQYQFGINRPMWIVHDEARADHAVLALPVLGTIEILRRSPDWFGPRVAFDWLEHAPKEAA